MCRNGQATTRTYSVPKLVLQLQRPIPLDTFILTVQVATDTTKPTAVVVLGLSSSYTEQSMYRNLC